MKATGSAQAQRRVYPPSAKTGWLIFFFAATLGGCRARTETQTTTTALKRPTKAHAQSARVSPGTGDAPRFELKPSGPKGGTEGLRPVSPDALCATQGTLRVAPAGGSVVTVRDNKMRAVAPNSAGDRAALRFIYHGPTRTQSRLQSGRKRTQIGLKLQASNGCNLIYVMWRISPDPRIAVSLKVNPGMQAHRTCKNGGYRFPTSAIRRPSPKAIVGREHTLVAELTENRLSVHANGTLVWKGTLGDQAGTLKGPVGLRTDNGIFEAELQASGPVRPRAAKHQAGDKVRKCTRQERGLSNG